MKSDDAQTNVGAKTIAYRLGACELWLSIVGSALFVVGSFLYRPIYSNDCHGRSGEKTGDGMCVNVTNQGTKLYIVGSIAFTIMAALSLVRIRLRASAETCDEKEGYGALQP